MRYSLLVPAGLAALLGASTVLAQEVECSLNKKCPEDRPCCSQYGACGVGAFCLGGCDPRMSFSLDSCVPAPVCQDRNMKLDSLDTVADVQDYLGDANKADWVVQGYPAEGDGEILLTMPEGSVGTVLASTVYMWYGTVKARMKTSRGAGVVTAFILLSDVKDEIDYEWVGVDLETSQTNYYFQGIPDYQNSGNISLSDTFNNYHDYEIRWTPDSISWFVDGQEGRKFEKKDTWNDTTNQWDYPQTPARVQLSIWPGGAPSNAPGTIQWAGGEIKWDHPDIENLGYYYVRVSDVSIECWNADRGAGTNKGTSYEIMDERGTNDTVRDGDKPTVLASFLATGLDMELGASEDDKDDDDEKPPQIPGGGSPGIAPGEDGPVGSGGGDGNGGSQAGGCDAGTFGQYCNDNKDGGGANQAGRVPPEKLLGASGFAVVVALGALLLF